MLVSAIAVGLTEIFAATVKVMVAGDNGGELPILDVTVTLKAPYGAVDGTSTVSVVVLPFDIGVTLAGLKLQVVPENATGRLVRSHASVTFVPGVPLVRVEIIVVEPEPPGTSVTPSKLERLYSKEPVAWTRGTSFSSDPLNTIDKQERMTRNRVFLRDLE